MLFSGRHYEALSHLYAESFGPQVPHEVAEAAARNGKAPELMAALYQAIQFEDQIQDWTPYAGQSHGESIGRE